MTSLLNLLWDYPNSYGWIYFLYGMILLGAGLINMFKVSITAFLNTISAWWHMVGVVFIVFVLAIVPDHHQSISYVFGQTINNTGFGGQSWTHGCLHLRVPDRPADGPVHDHRLRRLGAHERGDAQGVARRRLGHGHVGRRLGDLRVRPARRGDVRDPGRRARPTSSAFIVQSIWKDSMGTRWAELLLFIAVVAQCFCTIASTTSASRMMFAFSRDRAVPGHQLWRMVSKRDRIPVYTVTAISCSRS